MSQQEDLHALHANGLSMYCATWLRDLQRSARLTVDVWELEQRDDEQLQVLQRIVYAQFDPVNVVWTLDAEGVAVTAPTRITEPVEMVERGFQHHQSVSDDRLSRFGDEVPLSEAIASGLAWGRVYEHPDAVSPVVPLAIASGSRREVFALEVSLAGLDEHLASQALPGGATVLLADGVVMGENPGLIDVDLVSTFVGDVGGELEYDLDGQAVIAAFQSVPGTEWKVVVALPRAEAAMGAEAIRERYVFVFFMAMVFALAVGFAAAAQVSRPIGALRAGALRLGQGELGHQVQAEGAAEVAELGEAFNSMSLQLQEKTAEIEGFNRELQQRVDERTAELRESQDRLVQTARMAAVAQMGAGLAHELNNPIAGILGLAQVASMRAEGNTVTMLKNIEEQALRCRDILASLNRFSGGGGDTERTPVDLVELLGEVMALVGGGFEQAQVTVEYDRSAQLVVHGDAALLGQALAQLLRSLRTRLAPGGVLRLDFGAGAAVTLGVTMDGPERPGGDDWLASGMGFWVARRVFQDHGGRLREPSDDDPRWVLELPSQG